MSGTKKTLVIGASENPARYSFVAIKSLRKHGHPVVGIGNRAGKVADVAFSKERPKEGGINTVTLYLSAKHQEEYYDYIISLRPKRIIFNPGAENEILTKMAKDKGIQVMDACTLVLLSTGSY